MDVASALAVGPSAVCAVGNMRNGNQASAIACVMESMMDEIDRRELEALREEVDNARAHVARVRDDTIDQAIAAAWDYMKSTPDPHAEGIQAYMRKKLKP
jgi:hypothetical protein